MKKRYSLRITKNESGFQTKLALRIPCASALYGVLKTICFRCLGKRPINGKMSIFSSQLREDSSFMRPRIHVFMPILVKTGDTWREDDKTMRRIADKICRVLTALYSRSHWNDYADNSVNSTSSRLKASLIPRPNRSSFLGHICKMSLKGNFPTNPVNKYFLTLRGHFVTFCCTLMQWYCRRVSCSCIMCFDQRDVIKLRNSLVLKTGRSAEIVAGRVTRVSAVVMRPLRDPVTTAAHKDGGETSRTTTWELGEVVASSARCMLKSTPPVGNDVMLFSPHAATACSASQSLTSTGFACFWPL